ncbi:Alpha-1,6-mannosyl-glycoprotein 2-beta-N-acetylglucosaminyltransferase [Frankliniella fusca]|uniref:Alpha-1,6-mannosyl-glycoprotein 2-beta-N-acetylglucosaminyltransferase n=1 Tax=Frankliniella fusca TaxID=407009 RepID=A0AAE1HDJ8_9NEOP|nr:Alpha-1,6-mannosyl-glycoprotein 2-beta-N-acetylglucosaminyltransferase [Frankliniella fusca]
MNLYHHPACACAPRACGAPSANTSALSSTEAPSPPARSEDEDEDAAPPLRRSAAAAAGTPAAVRVRAVGVRRYGRHGPLALAGWCRTLLLLFLVSFVWLQLHLAGLNSRGWRQAGAGDASDGNDSAAILAMVPQVLHKYLVTRPRNLTQAAWGGGAGGGGGGGAGGGLGAAANDSLQRGAAAAPGTARGGLGGAIPSPDMDAIKAGIRHYNEEQRVLNEDIFGPLQPDALVVVVQVHTRIVYLRHLIVSLAQAKDIDQVLLVFSHDVYDPEVNELVQAVDFCKVMQIFYPFSIQTHPHSFPGESPDDCPRDMKKEEAMIKRCTNVDHPDLYGHYREAKFTQTKHHWWWKANRVFDQLEVTRNHTGLVLFLEEDHFVAEDFIHVLRLMQKTCSTNCPQCNILSLGTYLKTYNYYGGDSKKVGIKVHFMQPSVNNDGTIQGLLTHPALKNAFVITDSLHAFWPLEMTTGVALVSTGDASCHETPSGCFSRLCSSLMELPDSAFSLSALPKEKHVSSECVQPEAETFIPSAEVTPWISSKHNMGMAFNRSVWSDMRTCAQYFCTYDDYNWDWSLQHTSQNCLPHRLHAMVMKGPRVFHIGECGVHHKKTNCESTAVISKVQKVILAASRHLYPSHLTLTVTNTLKKTKLRKGNGGWGDVRDHKLCLNMTIPTR